MLVQAKNNIKGSDTRACPYQDLYIYIFQGVVAQRDETALGVDFIGNWVEDDSSFLFFMRPADDTVAQLTKFRPDLKLLETHHFSYEQWQGGDSGPVKVVDFVVVPAWEKSLLHDEGIRIVLDPGVVFGNGLHPTTRDCLRALLLTHQQRPFTSVLDLGTGTGVLAIAAALLGASKVVGVDINPLCIKTAMNNVVLNDLGHMIRMVQGPAEDVVHEPGDLVVANIHHEVILRLLERGVFRDAERFIISGLMRTQFRDVRNRLEMKNFQVLCQWDHDMTWFTLLAQRNKVLKV